MGERFVRMSRLGSNLHVLGDELVRQPGDRSAGDSRAAIKNIEAVGNFAAEVDVLIHEQNRETILWRRAVESASLRWTGGGFNVSRGS